MMFDTRRTGGAEERKGEPRVRKKKRVTNCLCMKHRVER